MFGLSHNCRQQGRNLALTFSFLSPPLSVGDMFEDPQWIPETMSITKLYISYLLYFPIHKYL